MTKQKIAIFGNCTTYPIYMILKTSAEFNKQYDIELLKHCFLCSKDDVAKIYEAVSNCNFLITQPISGQRYVELGLDTETLEQHLSNNARVIKIPAPYFTGYNPEQFYLHNQKKELVGCCEGLPHSYHNKIIMWGYINNINPLQILDILNKNDINYQASDNIVNSIMELERREQYLDLKISNFIKQNYKNNRLFWTINHSSNILLEYMSREILKLLKIEDDVKCEQNFLSEIQTPILNSVKTELQLNFKDSNIITKRDIKKYYQYYDKNPDLVEINKDIAIDFCKDIKINKKEKKYLLFGFMPLYKTIRKGNEVKKYILGIPYSSFQNKGDYTVKCTFFQSFKKKKSYMYSKYYFLGIQFWCKKKSKINILIDKIDNLEKNNNNILNTVRNFQNILSPKIKDLEQNNENILNAVNNFQNILSPKIKDLEQNNKNILNAVNNIQNILFSKTSDHQYENFLNIEIPQGHKILEYMANYKYYDRCLPRILKSISTKFDNFRLIDIGANIGDTAQNIRLAGLNFPILAIEGDKIYFEYLKRNQSVINNIDLCNVILADKDEDRKLVLDTQNGTGTLIASDNLTKVTSLDSLLDKFSLYQTAKFIKIDTDGFDNIILRGAKHYLTNAKPIIYMEYDPNLLIKNKDYGLDIFVYLNSLGYKSAIIYQNFGEYMFSFTLDNKQFISEMRDFFYKNNRICYADVLIFHEQDYNLFNEIRCQERDYFNNDKKEKGKNG